MPSKYIKLKQLSIRQRLLLAAALWMGGLILAAGIAIPTLVNTYLVENAKEQLRIVSDELVANLTVDKNGILTLPKPVSDPRFNRPYSGFYWSVTSKNKTLRSRSLWDQELTGFKNHPRHLSGANGEKLIHIKQTVTIPDYRQPLTITIGMDEDPIEHALFDLVDWLAVILSILFLGLMVFTFVQINWSLRPLSKLQKELKALETGKEKELSDDYPGEIKPLIRDLNALLFHYQELLARARNHAGNLSHSLKTPLSVLKNQITELPQKNREDLSDSVNRLQQQIDYHLGRARMAGAMNILSVKSNPSQRVDAISIAFDKVYAERELVLVNELSDDLFVSVEGSDLDEMLGNLIENSYKWSNSLIRVYADLVGSQVHIVVEDDGPGIPKEKLSHIIKRGVRLDETQPGSGLGLNIVAEMAHSYRGELQFESSKMGGLKAILTLNVSG